MSGGSLPANIKRTSVLRRVPSLEVIRFRAECGDEGDICAFELPRDSPPIAVESPTGRVMTIAPGDVFLATPGTVKRGCGPLVASPLADLFQVTTTGCFLIPELSVN